MPGAMKPHFNKTSFRLLQKQQEFLEDAVAAEEQKHEFDDKLMPTAPIASAAELHKVQAHMSKLDACFSELAQV